MLDFQITTQKLSDNIVAIAITGHLDSMVSPELEKTFQKFYNQGNYKFIVDLSGVDYLSSAGIGVFTRFLSQIRGHKGDIVLYQPKSQVIDVLSMLGLSRLITVVPDQPAALRSFGPDTSQGTKEIGERKIRKTGFQINTQELPDSIRAITITGRLDSMTSPELEKTFQTFYNQGIYRFIVDLSEVDYLSSAGAGVLIRFLSQVREHRGDIVLYQPKSQVIDILSILGLSQLIKVVSAWGEALKSLS